MREEPYREPAPIAHRPERNSIEEKHRTIRSLAKWITAVWLLMAATIIVSAILSDRVLENLKDILFALSIMTNAVMLILMKLFEKD